MWMKSHDDIDWVSQREKPRISIFFEMIFIGMGIQLPEIGFVKLAHTTDDSVQICLVNGDKWVLGTDFTINQLHNVLKKISDEDWYKNCRNLSLQRIRLERLGLLKWK